MGRRRRRRHSAEFTAGVIGECLRPGVSNAAVALAHGLNANMLRKWVIDAEHKGVRPAPAPPPIADVPMPPPSFVPLALAVYRVPSTGKQSEAHISAAVTRHRPEGATSPVCVWPWVLGETPTSFVPTHHCRSRGRRPARQERAPSAQP